MRDNAGEQVTLRCRFTNWDREPTRKPIVTIYAVNEMNETTHTGSFAGVAMAPISFQLNPFSGTVPSTELVMWGNNAGMPGWCSKNFPFCIDGMPSSLTINVDLDRGAILAACFFSYSYPAASEISFTSVSVNNGRPF